MYVIYHLCIMIVVDYRKEREDVYVYECGKEYKFSIIDGDMSIE